MNNQNPTKEQLQDLARQVEEAGIPNKLGACQLIILGLLKNKEKLEKQAPMAYIVVEEITGFIDGYYSKEEAIEVLEHWDKIRPQNKHFLFGGFKNPYERMRLTKNLYMPIVNRTEDKYIHGED